MKDENTKINQSISMVRPGKRSPGQRKMFINVDFTLEINSTFPFHLFNFFHLFSLYTRGRSLEILIRVFLYSFSYDTRVYVCQCRFSSFMLGQNFKMNASSRRWYDCRPVKGTPRRLSFTLLCPNGRDITLGDSAYIIEKARVRILSVLFN